MFSFLYDGRLGEMLAPTLSNDQLLYSACCNGNEDKVEALLAEEGINVQYRDGATARTLLHGACRSGSAELVDRLIGLGVDVRLAAHDGTTALHIAAQRGAADIVAKLIAKGADPLARDQAGQTPHAMCANYDLKKVLLRHMFPSQAREAPTAGAPPTSGAASAAVVAGGAAAAVEGNAAGAAAAGAMPPTEGEGAGGAGATPSASDAPPGEESGPPRSRLIQPDGFKTTVGDRALSTAFGNHATPAAGGFGSAPPPTDQAQQDAGASMWMSSGAPPRSTPRGYAGFSNPYSQSTQPAQMSMSKTPPSTRESHCGFQFVLLLSFHAPRSLRTRSGSSLFRNRRCRLLLSLSLSSSPLLLSPPQRRASTRHSRRDALRRQSSHRCLQRQRAP